LVGKRGEENSLKGLAIVVDTFLGHNEIALESRRGILSEIIAGEELSVNIWFLRVELQNFS
jgi:hypothetical protein